jgi:Subtilase family
MAGNLRQKHTFSKSVTAIVLAATTLAACSSGSPRSVVFAPNAPPPPPVLPPLPPPPPPPPITAPQDWRTTEFFRSPGLSAVKAEFAYSRGFTGLGVTIGLVDFNFDFTSNELLFHNDSRGPNQAMVDIYEAQIGEASPKNPHGQAVGVIAAGTKNGFQTHGVAFNAITLAVDFFSGVNLQKVNQNGSLLNISDPYTYLIDRGAKVVNISIGFDETDVISNPPVVGERYVVTNPAIVIERGALLVSSAGNNFEADGSNGLEPQLSNLRILDDANRFGLLTNGPGAFIIVGAVDTNNVIADFSDRAGSGNSKNFYLVAPGVDIVFPYTDGNLFKGNGTSFAAPHVTGAAAILFQQWPQLSAKDVAGILFASATDLGAPGIDPIYGNGLLNLDAATSPIGIVTSVFSGSGGVLPINDMEIILGGAFGDARPVGLSNIMGMDSFDREFFFDLSSRVIDQSKEGIILASLMESERTFGATSLGLGDASFSLNVANSDMSASMLALQSQAVRDMTRSSVPISGMLQGELGGFSWKMGTGMSLRYALGLKGTTSIRSVTMDKPAYLSSRGSFAVGEYSLGDKTSLSVGVDIGANSGLRFHPNNNLTRDLPRFTALAQINHYSSDTVSYVRIGTMVEKEALLGSRSAGGFGLVDQAVTGFAGLGGRYYLDRRINFEARVETGLTNVRGTSSASYFQSFNQFITSAWSARINLENLGYPGSRMSFGISQPLRVENANTAVLQAIGFDVDALAPIFESQKMSITPSGRELAMEAAWRYEIRNFAILASLIHRVDAGHTRGRRDSAAMLWFRTRF